MAVAQVTIAGISRENLEAEGVILRSDQNLIVILSGPDLTPDRPYQRLGVHAAGIGYHFTGGECDGVIIVASGDADLAKKLEAEGYAWLEQGGIRQLDVELRA